MCATNECIVLVDNSTQDRRMKKILKDDGFEILRQCDSSLYPLYYMLKESEVKYFVKVLNSVTWTDKNKEKHSLFDKEQPYTDVISLDNFIKRGGWTEWAEI